MLDLEASARTHPGFDRLEIGDLLFAHYTCPLREARVPLWSASDYLVHMLAGRKTWHTGSGAWTVAPGDTLFLRKGVAVVEQHFESDVCVLIVFLPATFVRAVVCELVPELTAEQGAGGSLDAIRVEADVAVAAFFQSMRTYFATAEKPPAAVLRLKLKEFIVAVLTGRRNHPLASYFRAQAAAQPPPVCEVMEANFRHNLGLDAFARLSRRSLTSFKRAFHEHYGQPPGRWLVQRRLEHALALLERTAMSVTEVAYECGFEETSHFTRSFKARFGRTPSSHRRACAAWPAQAGDWPAQPSARAGSPGMLPA